MSDHTRKKPPRDANQLGKMIVDISVGEIEDREPERRGRSGGLKGGMVRARVLSPAERSRIAKKAARARWKGSAADYKKEET